MRAGVGAPPARGPALPVPGVQGLVAELSSLNGENLLDRLTRVAATMARTGCAGFVEVDPLQECAWPVRVHVPPGDPLGIRRWLAESGALKLLATAQDTVRLAYDVTLGEPGFLAVPVPLATQAQAYVWVAGRAFDDADEHLLGRYATAAGRALEAARGMEAAVRLLRGVQSFR